MDTLISREIDNTLDIFQLKALINGYLCCLSELLQIFYDIEYFRTSLDTLISREIDNTLDIFQLKALINGYLCCLSDYYKYFMT